MELVLSGRLLVAAVLSEPVDVSPSGMAAWLCERRGVLDGGEAGWLAVLVDFDLAGGWADDGQLSCAEWLRWRCRMSRSTAFEKVRVAHALRRRPRLMAALASGELSYSAVRAMTRVTDPTPEVEDALIRLAMEGSVAALERAVRYWELLAEQGRDPDDLYRRFDRRGVRLTRGLNGKGTAEITLDPVELDEVAAAVDAFMGDPAGPVEESSAGDTKPGPAPYWQRRADAFMDLVRTGLAHAGNGHAPGADRYLVHVVADLATLGAGGLGQHLDGTPLQAGLLARLACDCSYVQHLVDGSEPLNLGRRTRQWNTAQRRAIAVRDGGRCRFVGCERRICDIHHLRPWDPDGPTDIDNGALICTRHHTLLHHGFAATGDANHQLAFTRPDGTHIGTTSPPARTPGVNVGR